MTGTGGDPVALRERESRSTRIPAGPAAGLLSFASSGLWPLCAALLFLVVLDPALIRPDSDDPLAVPLRGNIVRRLVLGSLYIAAAWGLWHRREKVEEVLQRQLPMVLLAGFAFASLLWSTAPRMTIVRAAHFAGILLLAWRATTSLPDAQRLTLFLRLLFPGALVLSCAWVVLFPDVAVHADGGAWAGIFRHKSELGSSAVFAFALWLPFLRAESESPAWRAAGLLILLLAAVLVWRSDSITELLGAALIVLLWIGLRVPGRPEIKLTLAPIPPLVALFWFWNGQSLPIDPFLQENLGRNMTLTGRTPLWDAVLENVWLHPLLGEGYDAFWVAGNRRAEYLIGAVGWDAYTAHNGYLEVLNTLGFVGLGLLLWAAWVSVRYAWRSLSAGAPEGEAVFLCLVWLLFSSLTKSVFCAGTSLGWVMFLVLCPLAAELTRGADAANTFNRRKTSSPRRSP